MESLPWTLLLPNLKQNAALINQRFIIYFSLKIRQLVHIINSAVEYTMTVVLEFIPA